MSSLTTYTANGNYMASSVDTSGNTVYYVYGEDGFLDSMTSGNSTVNFAYDSMGNLVELFQQNSINGYGFTMSNKYTYTNDRVTSITHNGFSYNFTYDKWGNQTTVSVGEHQLVGYEYDYANDNRLTKISYANGQSEIYTYDADGNITAISHDNGATATYAFTYDADGVLTTVKDNRCGLVTTYSDSGTQIHTADNTLVYSSVYNDDGTQTENVLGYVLTYTYNCEHNQVTGKTVSTKEFSNSTVVTEDEIEYSIDSNVDMSVTTDWFGRTESKEITVDSVKTNIATEETSELYVTGEYNYTYDDTDTTASTKVTAHSSSFTSNGNTYSQTDYYEYDSAGNITGIYRYVDGEKIYFYTYVYDEAGQIIRENILEDNKSILYYYDMGGNIFAKGEFEYTLGEITDDMSVVRAGLYTYENEDWCDQLTHYEYIDTPSDGDDSIITDITYDGMGNITSFDGQTYTWTSGRQLDTVVMDNGKYYKYYYNENGYLSKVELYKSDGTSGGVKQFIWDGDKLIAQNLVEDDSHTFVRTIYDSEDEAIGLIFRQYDDETDTGE